MDGRDVNETIFAIYELIESLSFELKGIIAGNTLLPAPIDATNIASTCPGFQVFVHTNYLIVPLVNTSTTLPIDFLVSRICAFRYNENYSGHTKFRYNYNLKSFKLVEQGENIQTIVF